MTGGGGGGGGRGCDRTGIGEVAPPGAGGGPPPWNGVYLSRGIRAGP